jgi:protein-tyrosine phosphatase
MIRFDQMSPEVMQAMCTPMHEVLPAMPPPRGHGGALWLGSLSASLDAPLLREHRIGHLVQVLDVPWLPDPATQGLQLETYRMDILDLPSADLRSHLEGACADISSALGRGLNVLVHCQQVCPSLPVSLPLSLTRPQGISRSAAVVIAYLIREHGMSYDQALAFVKAKRACIKPNSGFVACLKDWEKQWRARPDAARRHTAW